MEDMEDMARLTPAISDVLLGLVDAKEPTWGPQSAKLAGRISGSARAIPDHVPRVSRISGEPTAKVANRRKTDAYRLFARAGTHRETTFSGKCHDPQEGLPADNTQCYRCDMRTLLTPQGLRLRRQIRGLSQRELARQSGVSQPIIASVESGTRKPSESVSRSLSAALNVRSGEILEYKRAELLAALSAHGVSNVRVFGSVARGEDTIESDIDLMADFPPGTGYFALIPINDEAEEILATPTDLISGAGIGPSFEAAKRESLAL